MLATLSALLALATFPAEARGTDVSVSGAWSRPATGTAVVYMTIRDAGPAPDRLVGAESPVATHVGLHESYAMKMAGMGSMNGMAMNGSMMGMRGVAAIPVPAGGTTVLRPGGYHLMLDLRHDVAAGERIPLRLHFARAGWLTTTAIVRPIR
jgi:hypothetical protein